MSESTRKIYNQSATDWARTEPILLSDFTARPWVMDLCEPVVGRSILDVGCGEGYCARKLSQRGAGPIVGVDISEGMIERARSREAAELLNIEYRVGTATDLSFAADKSFDIVVAVFLFNYLTYQETEHAMREIERVLKPEGTFVFAVPHPCFPFLCDLEQPFFFDPGSRGYFSGRNHTFKGRIWRRDGVNVEVRCVHKTFGDYFAALRAANFTALPEVVELHVREEHLALDPDFFKPLEDLPLHVAFRQKK